MDNMLREPYILYHQTNVIKLPLEEFSSSSNVIKCPPERPSILSFHSGHMEGYAKQSALRGAISVCTTQSSVSLQGDKLQFSCPSNVIPVDQIQIQGAHPVDRM